MNRRSMLGLAGLLAVPGCGFRPMYMETASGNPGVAQRELAAVSVDLLPDRPGQLLRQALQQRLGGGSSGVSRKYDLGVNYTIGGEGIGIQGDNSVTRIRLIAHGAWTLRRQDPARSPLTSGSSRAIDGLNILNQQFFAADLEQEVVQQRLADAIADQIVAQLAAYFRKRAAAAPGGTG
ncbi:MAG: hypothetical protein JOZ42_02630 [Acetobacteraceae bacterium]|nr:hypothetical protein [Acetobacteraceae bacterium]